MLCCVLSGNPHSRPGRVVSSNTSSTAPPPSPSARDLASDFTERTETVKRPVQHLPPPPPLLAASVRLCPPFLLLLHRTHLCAEGQPPPMRCEGGLLCPVQGLCPSNFSRLPRTINFPSCRIILSAYKHAVTFPSLENKKPAKRNLS